ncbi:helix-turn-helix domain-containing protein [Pediococcus cellicola]|uniref:Transcriptional regulator n=1 Tax=Pediococcus cellicola TaxID=319652 RepID=A0A0R2IZE1_9LACO|nr:helix-turn-helix transcriptional regulator [Pediococcus cellicola]KRN67053.1 transcriptional regulator [Pediococcus cellicola]GEL15012.1 transcriptional regulator [Pediococcus cellicola]
MNLGKQIQTYRKKLGLSQEGLAAKIYVSRQTISNWETGHSYPDVENLLLLSVLFDVSLDELVKGDVVIMKNELERSKMDRYTKLMLLFMILVIFSVGPASFLPDYWWAIIPGSFWIVSMFFACRLEKIKHEKDIQTYQEIMAFMADQNLDSVRQRRNWFRDRLSKAVIVLVFAIIAGLLALLSALPYWLTH